MGGLVFLYNTLNLLQSRVYQRFLNISFYSSRFRNMQIIVKLLLKCNNVTFSFTFTLNYSFYNFYLLLISVGSRVSGSQVRDLH